MNSVKFPGILIISFFILTGCSIVNKFKEKLSGNKETVTKEQTKELTAGSDMNFYNAYIEVMNKIQDPCESIYRDYMRDVPEPGSVNKNSLIIPVGMQLGAQTLERTIKEYKRSLLDGGELSKLKASDEMQNELEADLKSLLPAMEEYQIVSAKVSDYYFKRDYVKDLTKVKPYDEEMKSAYGRYKTEFTKFSGALKKYKPERKIHDPEAVSDPDEKTSLIMLNAYGDILDAAESFYESFDGLEYKSDLTGAKTKLDEFEKTYNESKKKVMNAEFSEKIKFMKYNFEDYFSTTSLNFIDAGKTFFESAPDARNENAYKSKYNDVINSYNNMISSYNTSIGTINRIRSW
ncbi:MAG TPA: DUF3829 domain-containing protein [Ignavibacteria bacterium]|nr:DUF3829 domain-containing protein [Ignavibacteria bacterium]